MPDHEEPSAWEDDPPPPDPPVPASRLAAELRRLCSAAQGLFRQEVRAGLRPATPRALRAVQRLEDAALRARQLLDRLADRQEAEGDRGAAGPGEVTP
jgi:hypothetical protein